MTTSDADREREELAVAERRYERVLLDRSTPEERQAAAAAFVTEAGDVSPAEAEAASARVADAEDGRWRDDAAELESQRAFAAEHEERQREVEHQLAEQQQERYR